VPLDYWGYAFLDRMEAKGLFKTHYLRTRPLSRAAFADIIRVTENNLTDYPKLTEAEKRLFEQLKGDFIDELKPSNNSSKRVEKERHLFRWAEPHGEFHFDLHARETILSNRGQSFQPDELLSETMIGGIIRGQVGGQLAFYLNARNAATRGSNLERKNDLNFDPSKGLPINITGENVFRDQATAYFAFGKPWLMLEIGRDELDWGPGYHGGLMVSRNMPPTEMIKLSSRFRRFQFTSAHAFLRSSLGAKYLAAHRLDLMIVPGLYFGGSESVIYGNRDVELAYLNPIMPYQVAEHHLGDKDNNMLSVDFTTTLIPFTKLYGEFFIDDMTSTQSLTRYFGNKFAFLLGSLWADPLHLTNLDLRFEYARIEPFVYSHWDSINIYTNYDKIIGHWLGPNSDTAFLQAGYQLGRDTRLELSAERIRKGEGQANTVSRPQEGKGKKFLEGIVERRHLIGIKVVEQLRRDFFASISYIYSDTRNLSQIAGSRSFDHLARFEFYFNY